MVVCPGFGLGESQLRAGHDRTRHRGVRRVASLDEVNRRHGRGIRKLGRRDIELTLRGKSATLVIGETQSSPAELLLQDAVLFDKVVDDLRLMTIDPTGEGGEEELKAEDVRHDSVIVPVRRKVVTRAAAVRSSIRIPRRCR